MIFVIHIWISVLIIISQPRYQINIVQRCVGPHLSSCNTFQLVHIFNTFKIYLSATLHIKYKIADWCIYLKVSSKKGYRTECNDQKNLTRTNIRIYLYLKIIQTNMRIIPDFCHRHHGRCLFKFFLSGVNFSRMNAKK